MKRIIVAIVLLMVGSVVSAQTTKESTYPLSKNEKLILDFDYPELVKINTWDKNEVLIKSRVLINGEENTEDFTITDKRSSGELTIISKLKNLDKFKDHYISVSNDDDDDESITLSKNGKTISVGRGKMNYRGVEIEIVVEITLPKTAQVEVEAKYGIVEVLNLPKEIKVIAKYGGADIKVDEMSLGSLAVKTSWGQIFSNMTKDFTMKGDDMIGKSMEAQYRNAQGNESVTVVSEFGNIYLRKNMP